MSNDVEAALQEAQEALGRRAFKEAEVPFRTLLARDPENVEGLRLLAKLLRTLGRHDEALPFIDRLVELQPTEDFILMLYGSQMELRRLEDAEKSLERVFNIRQSPDVALRLAKIKKLNGKIAEGRDLIAATHAAFPDHIAAASGRADDLLETDSAAALAIIEATLARLAPTEAKQRVVLYRQLTIFRSIVAHRTNGKFGDMAADWDELTRWPDQEGLTQFENAQLQAGPFDDNALFNLGQVALARKDWDRAHALFQAAKDPKAEGPLDIVSFDMNFYSALEKSTDDDLFLEFPQVETLLPVANENRAMIFLGSDPVYFWKFTVPFLKQFSGLTHSVSIHVHLLDGVADEWQRCRAAAREIPNLSLSLSAESSGYANQDRRIARAYYHAARFVRLYQFVRCHDRSAYSLDVDVELQGDPAQFLEQLPGFDVACCGQAHTLKPWSKILGGCVGVSPTADGLYFARMVAAAIAHWRGKGIYRWGVDQAALFSAYVHMVRLGRQPKTLFLSPDIVGLSRSQDAAALFNFTTGYRKFTPRKV